MSTLRNFLIQPVGRIKLPHIHEWRNFRMSKILRSFKRRIVFGKWTIDSLAKMSVLISPWMREGVFFFLLYLNGVAPGCNTGNVKPK